MITIYKTVKGKLLEQKRLTAGVWIHAVKPSEEEIEQLLAWGVPRDAINSALDVDELARVEKEDGVMFLIIRVPFFFGDQVDIPYATIPLGIATSSKWLVTICSQSTELMRESRKSKEHPLHTKKHNTFILHILYNTAKLFLNHLSAINRIVDNLEDRLSVSIRNEELYQLLKYQKSLVFFSTALKTNELMIQRLQRNKLFQKFPEDEDLLDDVLTENMQAVEMTNISGNILSQMMDAFASMISNNQNNVIKLLTSVTIVLSIPVVVASFFGMNLPLPFQDHPIAFEITLAISVLISVLAILVFRKKDWF
ncbi:MAG TPA: magnesium transporter CorA family protein [Anaerolineales bacterium]|nr:magnesium transporter CorA family protein [Anaerolineales bacterium]